MSWHWKLPHERSDGSQWWEKNPILRCAGVKEERFSWQLKGVRINCRAVTWPPSGVYGGGFPLPGNKASSLAVMLLAVRYLDRVWRGGPVNPVPVRHDGASGFLAARPISPVVSPTAHCAYPWRTERAASGQGVRALGAVRADQFDSGPTRHARSRRTRQDVC